MRYFLKNSCDATIKGFETGDFTESDKIDNDNKIIFKLAYDRLTTGKINYFYEENENNLIIWHRSTRNNVKVQESHIWKNNGELIPVMHADINSAEELYKHDGFYTDLYILEG